MKIRVFNVDMSFLMLVVFNYTLGILAIENHALISILILVFTSIMLIIKWLKNIRQENKELNELLGNMDSLAKNLPLKFTITDSNDSIITTNITKKHIADIIFTDYMYQYKDNKSNIDNRILYNAIIRTKGEDSEKFFYTRFPIYKNSEILGYFYTETNITEITQYQKRLCSVNKTGHCCNQISDEDNEINNAQVNNNLINQNILDNNTDALLVYQYNRAKKQPSSLIFASKSIERFIDFSPTMLKSKNLYDLFHDSEKERVMVILSNISKTPILFETLMQDGDSNAFPVEINASLCEINGIETIELSVRNTKIRKDLEQKRDKNRMLSIQKNQVALAIYCLQIVLTKIGKLTMNLKNETRIINTMYKDTATHTGEIDNIAADMVFTIKSLILLYSPIHIKSNINIRNAIEQILEVVFFKEIMNNIVINVFQKGNVGEIYCTEDSIKYILTAFINNAKENIEINCGTGFYGEIDITIEEGDMNNILIHIEDNGGVIENGLLGRVFEPFFAMHDNYLGLGIPTAKIMIEEILHGSVSAKNAQSGPSFTINLPKN